MSSGGKSSIRVLLVDHQRIVRAGIRLLIESWPGVKVIGEAGTPSEARVIASREKPHIVLLDLDLGRAGGGLDCFTDLRSTAGEGRIIILTGVNDFRSSPPGDAPRRDGFGSVRSRRLKNYAGRF